eukprot:Seg330.16 transcript_id=Seg330.16/GoldUCD/mRNA.D3Y31 product="hypothetical protein" protein_id=Seg330.16/GoldUCD/D3Y31
MKINPNNRVFLLIIAFVGCAALWLLGGLPKLRLYSLSMTKRMNQNQLKMLHYNIWFGKFKLEERMKGIAQIIDKLKPNIITLNEVTKENLAMLKREDGLERYKVVPTDDIYKTMPADLPKIHLHTTVVLTDLPVVSWQAFTFENTKEGRRLVIAELRIPIYEEERKSNNAKYRNFKFVWRMQYALIKQRRVGHGLSLNVTMDEDVNDLADSFIQLSEGIVTMVKVRVTQSAASCHAYRRTMPASRSAPA